MTMDQSKKRNAESAQVEYLGRWVDRQHFTAFVYNQTEQRLAKSYDEFSKLISSGVWFDSKESAQNSVMKENLATEKKKSDREFIKNKLNTVAVLGK